ncbi:DinB family protein [Maribacter sp. 2307UL18-2]|uniref:DinB family protein n=1 Tax=Maribacter sp. 2307UL18-2 TaxID=3386274 RepID=UPI0039BC9D73
MNRRLLLSTIGLSPLALISAKIPVTDTPIVDNLIKRWKNSKTYTAKVFEAMPAEHIEYSPTEEQMSFAQHFMHLGYTNNSFIGVLVDDKTYPDYNALKDADFFLERPDPVSPFFPDRMQKREAEQNKALVSAYLTSTFDYVLSSLENLNDALLTRGEDKVKPWYLEGHTNLDLILRSESHTAHHRAQAITYLRMKGIQPPGYSKNNTF